MPLPRALLALLVVFGVAACGDPVPRPEPVVWVQSKPNPAVGAVEAAIVERPAPDRAVIEARWRTRAGHEDCSLEIVLPAGVLLVEGDAEAPIGPEGAARWQVEFPSGRDLDAVVRCCAHTQGGRMSCEVALRLVSRGD